ncbi:YgfZ/GcvT domain-containing protein [Oleisolibacter albus]|uniref:CAF17-like 4Fe-4S cluster assembly/insertion protein YgfZ n=1 Tax=Oleisolibacter albus TaxID=2171757 RepID=UPI000DF3C474|nr:folate-binding protein YgfZ [Oleisolibacter albus]
MSAVPSVSSSLSSPSAIPLTARGVIALTGADRISFLQGLVTADVSRVTPTRAGWGALLTPQGKFLHDIFFLATGDQMLLDVEAERLPDLLKRLRLYRLRAKVELTDASDRFTVAAVIGDGAAALLGVPAEAGAARPYEEGAACVDPRLPDLGCRLLLPREAPLPAPVGDAADWDRLRLGLGVPDGSRDLIPDKSILLENGFDELGGVAWDKGCYMGQELTARTRYRGLVKKRLLPVRLDGPLPAPGTIILAGDRDVGEIRSGRDGMALALLRLDALAQETPLRAGDTRLTPAIPDWVRLPAKA